MSQRIARGLAAFIMAVMLATGCSGSETQLSVNEAAETATVTAPPDGTELDAAVDALIDRLGPRGAFDAVLAALESGQRVDEIIADPDSVTAE